MNDNLADSGEVRRAGRTVRLFLVDGQPHGVVVADVGNWNGKALAAPRGRLSELLRRPEASRTGVYILLGPDPDQIDGVLAYIGEADDIAARMRIHLRSESKDFFDRVVFLVSSDEMLTKGHVRYLESRLIKLTQVAGSVALTNDTHPDFQRLPEADRADMDTFVENAAIVLPVLGCDLFRRRQRPQAAQQGAPRPSDGVGSPVFTFATGGASATGQETDEGFVVFAGSTARAGGQWHLPGRLRGAQRQAGRKRPIDGWLDLRCLGLRRRCDVHQPERCGVDRFGAQCERPDRMEDPASGSLLPRLAGLSDRRIQHGLDFPRNSLRCRRRAAEAWHDTGQRDSNR
jgi:hypothetical protein